MAIFEPKIVNVLLTSESPAEKTLFCENLIYSPFEASMIPYLFKSSNSLLGVGIILVATMRKRLFRLTSPTVRTVVPGAV